VFRPIEPVNLPDHTAVQIELRVEEGTRPAPMSPGLAKVYAVLGERFDSGEHDVAERHNDYQP
jgi:hypothetical protein